MASELEPGRSRTLTSGAPGRLVTLKTSSRQRSLSGCLRALADTSPRVPLAPRFRSASCTLQPTQKSVKHEATGSSIHGHIQVIFLRTAPPLSLSLEATGIPFLLIAAPGKSSWHLLTCLMCQLLGHQLPSSNEAPWKPHCWVPNKAGWRTSQVGRTSSDLGGRTLKPQIALQSGHSCFTPSETRQSSDWSGRNKPGAQPASWVFGTGTPNDAGASTGGCI